MDVVPSECKSEHRGIAKSKEVSDRVSEQVTGLASKDASKDVSEEEAIGEPSTSNDGLTDTDCTMCKKVQKSRNR
jgi:hypothetical protein